MNNSAILAAFQKKILVLALGIFSLINLTVSSAQDLPYQFGKFQSDSVVHLFSDKVNMREKPEVSASIVDHPEKNVPARV